MPSPQRIDLDSRALDSASKAVAFRDKTMSETAIRMLASEVIVRLSERFPAAKVAVPGQPSNREIEAFADALVSSETEAGLSMILGLRDKGVSRDDLYMNYISTAARRLGERWERDEIPFTDVTIGAGRLYVIMRALRPAFVPADIDHADRRRALFVSTPGEDHTLGVTMAADMFRDTGWTIELQVGLEHEALVDCVAERHYPVIGISASSGRMIVPLTRLIASMRLTSPASAIVVSGELVTIEPDLATIVDADGSVGSPDQALAEMERLVAVE